MVAKRARYLAPLALAAVAVGTYLIVHTGLNPHHATATQSGSLLSSPNRPRSRRRPRFYVVKPGDTLSAIAVKTHLTIYRITSLNPGLSPNSLSTGQRLRLRR
jgi:LysM repeat protein